MGICITRVFFVWSLYCLSIFDLLLMITSLVSYDYLLWLPVWYLMITCLVSYDYLLWLPAWYLMITSLVSYDYLLWLPLWYLMITSLVSSNISYVISNYVVFIFVLFILVIVLSVFLSFAVSDSSLWYFETFLLIFC
jgi:hypothetical protein